jgi:hypothetical protein
MIGLEKRNLYLYSIILFIKIKRDCPSKQYYIVFQLSLTKSNIVIKSYSIL